MKANSQKTGWILNGMLGEAIEKVVKNSSTNMIITDLSESLSNDQNYVVCTDYLDAQYLKKIEEKFLLSDKFRWTFVTLYKNFVFFGPIFERGAKLCVDCLVRRFLSSPPNCRDTETEFRLLQLQTRFPQNFHTSFTPLIPKIAVKLSLARFKGSNDKNCNTSYLYDQLGYENLTSKVHALHGCNFCRKKKQLAANRFVDEAALQFMRSGDEI